VPEMVAPVSVDEFWDVARGLERAELVGGQVVELVPPGFRHGEIAATISHLLHEYITRRGLGAVVGETGFILSRDPATVRAPDVAVVLSARVPAPRPFLIASAFSWATRSGPSSGAPRTKRVNLAPSRWRPNSKLDGPA